MSAPNESVIVLSRALDQAGDVLAAVHEDQLSQPTPCRDWDVAQLIAHVRGRAAATSLQMSQGGEPDWSRDPVRPPASGPRTFRAAADDLIHFWHQQATRPTPVRSTGRPPSSPSTPGTSPGRPASAASSTPRSPSAAWPSCRQR